ncbi:MAG: hypothetical protein ACW99J_20820 [Candidatus Thorarchaeota archaeon]|jgi:hypothetical protein
MNLFFRVLLAKVLGRSTYDAIVSPLNSMKKALEKLIEIKADNIAALTEAIAEESHEQQLAQGTLDGLKKVV